jgi:hypothetical protein
VGQNAQSRTRRVAAHQNSDEDDLSGSGIFVSSSVNWCCHRGHWPSMEVRDSMGSVLEGHVWLSSAANLPPIIRSVPCRLDSGIDFQDVATMKVWKRLTTILKAGDSMWTTVIMRLS